ncbi:uncharacterized protein LOC133444896 [Cololabis saira]|uniref:uncharacterized protein LOC133444896 n=1 Tax=Cololabis saira TaxID=129043 RepID=UPI002AD321B5|nr:uncharacterized protein LOC133444896 [Cololabis saira]
MEQSLGTSAGVVLSSEDVSLLFSKVFHVNSNTSEARAAMKKISGGDTNWSCTSGNILDVLLEMEKEKDRKEMLYWEFQIVNGRSLHHMKDSLHQCTDPDMLKNAYNSESCTIEIDSAQIGGRMGVKELFDGAIHVKRLKKASRQRWVGLASEGVQSLLPFPWWGQSIGLRGQAWGCVSLSDILLLVEVKYDVVKQLLYTEMLQEHHTRAVWEKLLPWQQQEEVELLEDLTEEALESLDMLHLALLPGAFRIYKAYLNESRQQSWSAVSLLKELHKCCQQEQDTLTALGQRLLGESPTQLCLFIRLATLKAQRETMSYRALLAAQQSWESWPQIVGPSRVEQITLWLHGDEEEEEKREEFKTLQQVILTVGQ